MGLLDAPALTPKAAAAKYSPLGGSAQAAWIGDSLTANGFISGPTSVGQYVGTLQSAVSAGATSLSALYPYTAANGYSNVTPPQVNGFIVIEPGTVREEIVAPSAVTGTGPYTLTVPALTYAHAAGSEMRGYTRWFNSQSVPMWVSMLSGGAIQFGEIYAHGGYTTAQIRNIYLPQLLAAKDKPGVAFYCTGTNDDYDLTTAFPLALDTIDQIRAAGIVPIVVGVAPGGSNPTGSDIAKKTRWNMRMGAECRKRGVVFVDVFASLVDDGTGVAGSGSFKTRLNLDNIHPNDIGAKAWATALWSAVSPMFTMRTVPTGVSINTTSDTAVYPFNTNNAVLITDTNADGIPDNWTKTQGNAGDTIALEAVGGVPGKMLSITRAANGTTDPIVQYQNFTLTPGVKYRAILRLSTSGVDATYDALSTTSGAGGGTTTSTFAGFDVRCMASTGQISVCAVQAWKRDVALTIVEVDFVMPAGLSNTTMVWHVRLRGSASTPAYTVKVQPFLVNLTALGI